VAVPSCPRRVRAGHPFNNGVEKSTSPCMDSDRAEEPCCHEPVSPLDLDAFWRSPRIPVSMLHAPRSDVARRSQRVRGFHLLNWGPHGVGAGLTAKQLAAGKCTKADRMSLACFDADEQVTPALVQIGDRHYRLPPGLWAAAREAATDAAVRCIAEGGRATKSYA